MSESPNRFELIGYLDEALPPEDMTRIEEQLRVSEAWRNALVELLGELDSGEHSIATIWRRHRLTCPSRERLGAYLVQGLLPDEEDYVRFHLDVMRCRWCNANLSDLKLEQSRAERADHEGTQRRRRVYESSIGRLPPPAPIGGLPRIGVEPVSRKRGS